MAVVEKTVDKTAQEQEERTVEEKKRTAINAVISSLDLPVTEKEKKEESTTRRSEAKPPATEEKKTEKREFKKEVQKEEEVEEFESDKTDAEILEADDKDLNPKEKQYKQQLLEEKDGKKDDDELIPRSKVQKRIDALTSEIKLLRKQVEQVKPADTQDPDTLRLNAMDKDKLTHTKDTIKREIRETYRKMAKGETVDESRLEALEVASDKAEEALKTYPERVKSRQLELYNKQAEEIITELSEDLSENEIIKASKEIKEIAQTIYASYPKLQQSEDGQALALKLASDHWKSKKEVSAGRSKVDEMRRTTKRLMRRTTLDSNSIKRDGEHRQRESLRENAVRKGGTERDKIEYIKSSSRFNIDSLIPDEFK